MSINCLGWYLPPKNMATCDLQPRVFLDISHQQLGLQPYNHHNASQERTCSCFGVDQWVPLVLFHGTLGPRETMQEGEEYFQRSLRYYCSKIQCVIDDCLMWAKQLVCNVNTGSDFLEKKHLLQAINHHEIVYEYVPIVAFE
jgi:hypothetical protein